ncbi:MAG: hypothetical protein LC725_07525, partial [Lentisphaerae bacterium]|nr:hypothetical protein [Lentisphaerota bacterium]
TDGVMDQLTATALALETVPPDRAPEHVILVSCDLRSIRDGLRDALRENLAAALPGLDPLAVILNATHTHSAPPLGEFGIELDGMSEAEYQEFVLPRLAQAVRTAWESRQPGGISFGLGHAVVGRNRLTAYSTGRSKIYGSTGRETFSHIEGYEDHAVNLLYTWDAQDRLTGVLINIAAPSQISRSSTQLSADFWHDTRLALRRELGPNLFVLPQCSAAGDQDTNILWAQKAETRMMKLAGRNLRQELAERLTRAVTSILPLMQQNIERQPVLRHELRTVKLPRRMLAESDLEQAVSEARPHREKYEKMLQELEANPDLRNNQEWLREITRAYWRARRGQRVEERYTLQQTDPFFQVEVHALRLGDMAIVTNPFELYLDYGVQLKARSPAVQTFIVQLASGSSGYLPTERSVAGGAYGAVPASTNVGPEGGRQLVEETLKELKALWEETE